MVLRPPGLSYPGGVRTSVGAESPESLSTLRVPGRIGDTQVAGVTFVPPRLSGCPGACDPSHGIQGRRRYGLPPCRDRDPGHRGHACLLYGRDGIPAGEGGGWKDAERWLGKAPLLRYGRRWSDRVLGPP